MTGHTDLRTLDRPFLVDKVVMNRTYHELSLYKCIANINYFEAVASIQRDIYIYISVTICQDNLNYLVCLVRPKYLGRWLAISTHWQIIAEWESFHFQVLLSDPSDFDGGINCFDGQGGERQVRRKGGNLCWTKWVTLREREIYLHLPWIGLKLWGYEGNPSICSQIQGDDTGSQILAGLLLGKWWIPFDWFFQFISLLGLFQNWWMLKVSRKPVLFWATNHSFTISLPQNQSIDIFIPIPWIQSGTSAAGRRSLLFRQDKTSRLGSEDDALSI